MESGKVKAPVMIKDSSSSEEPAPRHRRVSVSPQEAEVAVTFEDEIVGERIPVKVSVTGEPHAGLQVESVKVIPDSVSIRGSAAAVRSIDSLVLAPVDITGLEQDIQLMIPMEPTQLPPGVEITGTDRARVEIHLSKKMSVKTFQNVPLMIAGNTASKEWRFSPPTASAVRALRRRIEHSFAAHRATGARARPETRLPGRQDGAGAGLCDFGGIE